MNFPDVLRTICGTRLPIPLSPLSWPDTFLGTLHLLMEPRLHPTLVPRFDL